LCVADGSRVVDTILARFPFLRLPDLVLGERALTEMHTHTDPCKTWRHWPGIWRKYSRGLTTRQPGVSGEGRDSADKAFDCCGWSVEIGSILATCETRGHHLPCQAACQQDPSLSRFWKHPKWSLATSIGVFRNIPWPPSALLVAMAGVAIEAR
jgi:hypothetical protein